LLKIITAYSNLYGLVLYGIIMDEHSNFKYSENGHYFSIKKINQVENRYLFFVRNFSYAQDLSINALTKIYQSFE
jgi:hypothetical protein